MAKPNYAYAKRQRDLAKKAKNEEKRARKLQQSGREPPAQDGSSVPAATEAPKDEGQS